MNWLVEWFFGQVEADREASTADPGLPAYPWLADGTPTPELIEGASLPTRYPVSYVAAAIGKRYPVLINLDQLRRSVHLALAGTPDLRTPAERRRDTWLAYQAAKEKYLGKA